MEKRSNKKAKEKVTSNGIIDKPLNIIWDTNITFIDISNRNISNLSDKLKFPPNLMNLNISKNCLVEIPSIVLELNNLKVLDASFNKIKYFDDIPNFVQSIESLNLASNNLEGPPYWVWSETPPKLMQVNLCGNELISNSLEDYYFNELLQYTSLVTNLNLKNCALKSHIELLQCFPHIKILDLGSPDSRILISNKVLQVPCKGLDRCCDIERLNLCNVQLYSIENNIDIYKNLIEINVSLNNIVDIPKEFCNLELLEICILSNNGIIYLPDEFTNLKKLRRLHLDGNELCMLPKDIGLLPDLKVLDIYDNRLYEVSEDVRNISEIDFALNYFEEPEDEEYLVRRQRLRLYVENRIDGRKKEPSSPESSHSPETTDDEELLNYLNNIENNAEPPVNPPSSPEDWDSDDYWVPVKHFNFDIPRPRAAWMAFVRTKMAEGNFCPMDIHPVSVAEQVQYEKMCNPKVWTEVSGQFDDCTDEES